MRSGFLNNRTVNLEAVTPAFVMCIPLTLLVCMVISHFRVGNQYAECEKQHSKGKDQPGKVARGQLN